MFVMSLRMLIVVVRCNLPERPLDEVLSRTLHSSGINQYPTHRLAWCQRQSKRANLGTSLVYRCPSSLECENQDRNRRFLHFAL